MVWKLIGSLLVLACCKIASAGILTLMVNPDRTPKWLVHLARLGAIELIIAILTGGAVWCWDLWQGNF